MKQYAKTYLKQNVMTLVLAVFLIAMLICIPQQIKVSLVSQDTVSPRFFPYVSTITALVCCVASLLVEAFSLRAKVQRGEEVEGRKDDNVSYGRVLICIALLFVWYLIINYVGFIISTILITLILSYMLGNRNKLSLVLFPVCFTLVIYFVFANLLHVNLPEILF